MPAAAVGGKGGGPTGGEHGGEELEEIGRNIAAVQAFYAQQAAELSRSQRLAERIAGAVGRPAFLAFIAIAVVLWIAVNEMQPIFFGRRVPDPAPYFALQGLLSLCALLVSTVVLIKQNRAARLSEQRAHLDLRLTLLIEQKAAKLIDLMEELRRDAPGIPDRHDPRAAVLQHAMDPDGVLAVLAEPTPEGTPP